MLSRKSSIIKLGFTNSIFAWMNIDDLNNLKLHNAVENPVRRFFNDE